MCFRHSTFQWFENHNEQTRTLIRSRHNRTLKEALNFLILVVQIPYFPLQNVDVVFRCTKKLGPKVQHYQTAMVHLLRPMVLIGKSLTELVAIFKVVHLHGQFIAILIRHQRTDLNNALPNNYPIYIRMKIRIGVK